MTEAMPRVELTGEQLSEMLTTATELVRRGGEMVREAIGNREKAVEKKESEVDLVTETDRAVERNGRARVL